MVIVIDALRADHLGIYGYHRETSPNINKFARKGLIYNRAIVQAGWTKPSISSLFTSTYASIHKVTEPEDVLPGDFSNIAEIFQQNGYFTVGLFNNGLITSDFNFNRGFCVYKHYDDDKIIDNLRSLLTHRCLEDPNVKLMTEEKVESFSQFQKLFIYAHLLSPHAPYEPPAHYLKLFDLGEETTLLDKYDAEIRALDDKLGVIFEALAFSGRSDNTLVIITADHGEAFGEHGVWEHHQSYFYEPVTRVPLILYNPVLFPEPAYINATVEASVGLLPSLVDLLKLKVPPGIEFQGHSFFSSGDTHLPVAFYYEGPCLRMVTDDKWKYVSGEYVGLISGVEIRATYAGDGNTRLVILSSHGEEGGEFSSVTELRDSETFARFSPAQRQEIVDVFNAAHRQHDKVEKRTLLFNIQSDPGEKYNVADLYPEVVKKMQRFIHDRIAADRFFQNKVGVVTGERLKLNDAMIEKLKALGYLQ